MNPPPADPRLVSAFRRVIAVRGWILLLAAVLAPPAVFLARGVRTDNALERMVVSQDPDYVATRAFQKVFPEKRQAVLLLETGDPLAPAAIAELDALEAALRQVPHVTPISVASIYRRVRPRAPLRDFVLGTSFFRRRGLLGDRFLGLALELEAKDAVARDAILAQIDQALAATPRRVLSRVRRIGEPFVESYLERETARANVRYFPLFGLFVVGMNLALYRSGRSLLAFLLTLGASVLFATALGALAGFTHSLVSALVPLTVMTTCTASLVYLHSRFVDRPAGVPVEEHRVFALANKFVPVTASIFAAAVGFAALSVSPVRPVREMGLWTAGGLVVTWLLAFTLFPALQKVLRAPTGQEVRTAGPWVERAAARLPLWSYRWRHALVTAALALSVLGAGAVFGVPGLAAPMWLETDSIDYVDRATPLYEDVRWFEASVLGLPSAVAWVETVPGGVLEPSGLAALDRFTTALEAEDVVGSVTGLPSVMRFRRYAAGLGEELPREASALAALAAELEQLMLQEPALRSFVDMASLSSTYFTVAARAGGGVTQEQLQETMARAWASAAAQEPALARARMRVVGQGLLTAKISRHLVPTLIESLLLTFAVIFAAFLLVFRSGAARLLAMVPSLFAILAMFLLMRLFDIPLNVATILIATTVLGATESDQVHFFYHFQEKRREAGTREALAHAIRVAGSAIFFATLINAAGFLALALSELPPMRQFGILTSSAFLLALIADFTALPAALWLVFRERPEGGNAPCE